MMSVNSNEITTFLKIVCSLLVLILLVEIPAIGIAEEAGYSLFEVGQPGPKAVDLKVWAEQSQEYLAKTGVPAVVHVKSSDKAYLAAIYVAPKSDAIVLLPNRTVPDSVVLPNQEYSLFGPESQLQLKQTDIAKDAKIIFYVSSTPLPIGDLRIPPGETFARLRQSSGEDVKVLTDSLKALAKDPTFNRKVLSLLGGGKKGLRLELMDLPPDVTSSKPTGVTGAPGMKEKAAESGKE